MGPLLGYPASDQAATEKNNDPKTPTATAEQQTEIGI
jgi:hypothetical protein